MVDAQEGGGPPPTTLHAACSRAGLPPPLAMPPQAGAVTASGKGRAAERALPEGYTMGARKGEGQEVAFVKERTLRIPQH